MLNDACRGFGGILTGDVVIAVDGSPVKRANDLANALDERKVGETITLRVMRSEKSVRGSRFAMLHV